MVTLTVFGEIEDLMGFIRKCSADYIEEEKIYIDKAKNKTTLIKIKIYSNILKHRV